MAVKRTYRSGKARTASQKAAQLKAAKASAAKRRGKGKTTKISKGRMAEINRQADQLRRMGKGVLVGRKYLKIRDVAGKGTWKKYPLKSVRFR